MTDHFALTIRHADGTEATAASASYDELVAFLKQCELCGSELLGLIRVAGPPPDVLGVGLPTFGEGWVELPAVVHPAWVPFTTPADYLGSAAARRPENADDDLRIPQRPDVDVDEILRFAGAPPPPSLFPRSRVPDRVPRC